VKRQRAGCICFVDPLLDDRPLAVGGRLKPAPPLVMDNAAGCISSTPRDMGRYLQICRPVYAH
jgi:hypothetical protein